MPKFGMMNNPTKPLLDEIRAAQAFGCDFLDLTLEPPWTGPDAFDLGACREALAEAGLPITAHTGWHLPGNAAYPEVRRGVSESLLWAAKHFVALGAKTMTYHIQGPVASYIGAAAAIEATAQTLRPVVAWCGERDLRVVLEHIRATPDQFRILDALFERIPELGFHLDAGHANLSEGDGNRTPEFLRRYGSRLGHVHFSDNRGRHDDHMPLGVGTVPWAEVVDSLKALPYEKTITLECFTSDPRYFAASLEIARSWW